jgi:hypothetical protein
MFISPSAKPVPIQPDEGGTLRVGGTRVTLQSIIYNFM